MNCKTFSVAVMQARGRVFMSHTFRVLAALLDATGDSFVEDFTWIFVSHTKVDTNIYPHCSTMLYNS